MSPSFNRRAFTRGLSLSGFAYLGFRLTGCGPSTLDSRIADDGTVFVGETVTMYDLRMEAWSTLGSGQLGFTGTLKASQIKDNKDVSLVYSQDGDGHTFEISKADLLKLRHGEKISVITTKNQGHTHEVRIHPTNNRVPGSEGITMPIDPDATVPEEHLFATFDESPTPNLYVAGSKELDPTSVEFCIAAEDKCATDDTLWKRLKTYTFQGRTDQVFVSEANLPLDLVLAEQPLAVRAKTKAGAQVLQQLFRLLKP